MIPISVWVVEDDSVYRRTLMRMLNREENISCTRVFPSCIEMLEAVGNEPLPDLVLMDLGLPEMSGVEGIHKLAKVAPDVTVMVITVFKDKERVLQALDAGAAGYLLKTATASEIIKGIRDVFMGTASLSPAVAKIVLEEIRNPQPADDFGLSSREIEVLKHLASGLSVKEIGSELNISTRTARFHLSNIYEKLKVQSQSGAVAKAMRARLI